MLLPLTGGFVGRQNIAQEEWNKLYGQQKATQAEQTYKYSKTGIKTSKAAYKKSKKIPKRPVE
jgi:hypothetical protein